MADLPYYVATEAPKRLPKTKAEEQLRGALPPDAEQIVSSAVKQWREPLRGAVRDITALTFTNESGQTVVRVPIKVIDGLPLPLTELTDDIEPWQWWLILHEPALERSRNDLKMLTEARETISSFLGDISEGMSAATVSRRFIDRILERSAKAKLIDRFREIQVDIFGAYWIQASKIQIYWMPLAIFAPLLGVPLSTLTAVVLCHELVHAYTHRGFDLNKRQWPDASFIKSDPHVTEGLAQYYTEQIMRDLGARLPGGIDTFLTKTHHQSSPYKAYRDWLGQDRQPNLEAARIAMLEFRCANPPIFSHQEFIAMLKGAQAQMGNPVLL